MIKPDGTTQLALAISDVSTRQGLLSGMSLACCFYGYTPDQQTRFFKDVAQNRGVRIEFFGGRDAALRWLELSSQL